MDHVFVRLLKVVAVVGMALSLLGLVLMCGIRMEQAMWMPKTTGVQIADSLRHVLDGMKEAGVTMLLSAILFVACVVAQRLPRSPTSADDHD